MLFLLVDIINLDKKIIAPCIALEIAIIVSFILHDNITFKKSKNSKIIKRFSKFHVAALSGFLLNLIIYNIILKYGGLALILGKMDYLASQMIAVFIVVFWNYFINSRWTWTK
jgi:dolichol-phosphate mannosyltransferase